MVSVGGDEFEVRTVSDSQFHALGIDDVENDRAPNLEGQTVLLLERASDCDVKFVSAINLGISDDMTMVGLS